jgi:hypothetical protein
MVGPYRVSRQRPRLGRQARSCVRRIRGTISKLARLQRARLVLRKAAPVKITRLGKVFMVPADPCQSAAQATINRLCKDRMT